MARRAAAHLPAPPVAACRRLCADREPARRDGADPQCRDGGPHLHRMGQGRHRRTQTDEGRSEEHTSELQSLMRISYAVFCLKKKKRKKSYKSNRQHTKDKKIIK